MGYKVVTYLIIVIAVVAGVALYYVDPAQVSWAPKCMIHSITGLQCPACGISRATHALLHGRVLEAWSYNWFFIISIPYLIAVVTATYSKRIYNSRVGELVLGRVGGISFVVLFLLWFVIRNVLGV